MKSYLAVAAILMLINGCNRPATQSDTSTSLNNKQSPDTAHSAHNHSHDHTSHGPHHGLLIELGNDAYHAELVLDGETTTIYILDGSSKNSVPIAAKELTINLVRDGKPEQFMLAASPDPNDPDGQSSRFSIHSPTLIEELSHDHANAKLSFTISGTAYRGAIILGHTH